MKYLLKNDLSTLKKCVPIVALFTFVPMIVYAILLKIDGDYTFSMFLNVASLDVTKNLSVLEFLLFISCIFSYVYISYSILVNNIKNACGNIFLRIQKKRWITMEIFAFSLCIFLYTIIRLILFNILACLLNQQVMIMEIFKALLYYLPFCLIFIILIFYGKTLCLLFVVASIFLPVSIYNINRIYILILYVICIVLLTLTYNLKTTFVEKISKY